MINDNRITYILAGDEMKKLFAQMYPTINAVPFKEDLSLGDLEGYSIDEKFIEERSSFWGVTQEEYAHNISPIVELDITRSLALVFGEDDCCKANMAFMMNYLRQRGYAKPLKCISSTNMI